MLVLGIPINVGIQIRVYVIRPTVIPALVKEDTTDATAV